MADPNPKSQAEQDADYQNWLAQQPRQRQSGQPGAPAPGQQSAATPQYRAGALTEQERPPNEEASDRTPAATVPSDQSAEPSEVWPDATELVALLVEAREYLAQYSVHGIKDKIDMELNGAWAQFGVGAANGENTDFRFSSGLTEATEVLVDGEPQEFEVVEGQTARLTNAPADGARVVARRLRREVAVGAVDGSNRDFTLQSPILRETEIYVDGKPYPYDTVNARTVRLVRAPPVGSHVEAARVRKAAAPGGAGAASAAPKPTAPPTAASARVPPMEQGAAASQPPPTP